MGRMTTVADTYHSMTSDRPYRKGMDRGKVIQIIEEATDTQLCSNCVALFFRWITQEDKDNGKRKNVTSLMVFFIMHKELCSDAQRIVHHQMLFSASILSTNSIIEVKKIEQYFT